MKTWDEVVEGYRQRFIEYFSKGDVPGFSEQACREMMYVLEYQKTGKWIQDALGTTICSNCKGIRRDCRTGHTNFCNMCGTDMREDGGECTSITR